MRDGTMPFLARFVAEGARGILRSTVHPLTMQAWPSLMTGVSPGEHGVFDFVKVDRRPDRLTYVLGTSGDLCSETIWSIAGRKGRRVICLNFPSMFPVPAFPGESAEPESQASRFIIPGFVPWQYLPRAVRPASLYQRIRSLPGFQARELALDWDLERKALQGLPEKEYDSWIRFHTLREEHWFEILQMLMREEPSELTAVLFDGVDKLQHLCYHLIAPDREKKYNSPWARRMRGVCRHYFRQLDRFLERIVRLAGPQARVFIASDHGFTLAGSHIFYANVWLEQHGYLKWAEGVPLDQERRLTLDGHSATDEMFDWTATTACALTASSNAIHIHQPRAAKSKTAQARHLQFRNKLRDSLLAFKDDAGAGVIEAVLVREEAFPGKRRAEAPDLTVVLRDRSFLSVLRADAILKPRRSPYGTHHPDGIFLARGQGVRKGARLEPAPIISVAPTLLYSLGLPVPEEMEGRVHEAAFQRAYLTRHPIEGEASGSGANQPAAPLPGVSRDEAEKAALVAQLQALGYLE
jgi:predicted AlkP superfamily phosphohydrolase/phosphomutase